MAEQAFLATPTISGGGRVIASPFQWLFGGDDNLRIMLINSASGVVVTVQGRFWSKDRGIQPFQFPLTPTSDRVVNEFNRPLGDGYLLNLSLVASSGAPLVGQTYCMVQVIRGLTGATILLGCLLGGYVTAMQHIAFPGSPIESSIAGGGVIRTVTGTNPAAGAEVSETVPTGARWELLAMNVGLFTSGVAGNRRPRLVFADSGGNGLFVSSQVFTLGAGSSAGFTWAEGMPIETAWDATSAMAGLAAVPLLAAQKFRTSTLNLDANDDYSAPTYTVREWLEAA